MACKDCGKPSKGLRCRKCSVKFYHDHPEERHWIWKGGKCLDSKGYVRILKPEHPKKHKGGNYVFEHRFVMEQALGRPLDDHEHIHHLDLNPVNNSPDNLTVTHLAEHMGKYHKGPVICKDCGREERTRKGYCLKCYHRWRNHGFPESGPPPPRKKSPPCIICGAPHLARGYCQKHYDANKNG